MFIKRVIILREIVHSIGIDIGTSTTQLVFSRLVMENLAGNYAVPRISIVEKEITYRSKIYFTPLLSASEIDAEGLKAIIREEYLSAGMKPSDLQTGAVIITGDTARKKNANAVLEALSDMAGDFVVATAGPDLESVLAARGAGTDKFSEEHRTVIANADVGGGTCNIALYDRGALCGVSCLDIGGRLVKIENGRISYVFPKTAALAAAHGIKLELGARADVSEISRLCSVMADNIAKALYLREHDAEHTRWYTHGGRPLPQSPRAKGVTFSGGVADYIYHADYSEPFKYGDIGILLGKAIRENSAFKTLELYKSNETIRATVVGAGVYTVMVSGSTISYMRGELPIKNIPILKISSEEENSADMFAEAIKRRLPLYKSGPQVGRVAIAFSGEGHTSFSEVQNIAAAIIRGAEDVVNSPYPLIVVVENDIGKVLGNALAAELGDGKDIVSIDGISVANGDYIDIGEPIAGGHVVPVVVKTLIFNS